MPASRGDGNLVHLIDGMVGEVCQIYSRLESLPSLRFQTVQKASQWPSLQAIANKPSPSHLLPLQVMASYVNITEREPVFDVFAQVSTDGQYLDTSHLTQNKE